MCPRWISTEHLSVLALPSAGPPQMALWHVALLPGTAIPTAAVCSAGSCQARGGMQRSRVLHGQTSGCKRLPEAVPALTSHTKVSLRVTVSTGAGRSMTPAPGSHLTRPLPVKQALCQGLSSNTPSLPPAQHNGSPAHCRDPLRRGTAVWATLAGKVLDLCDLPGRSQMRLHHLFPSRLFSRPQGGGVGAVDRPGVRVAQRGPQMVRGETGVTGSLSHLVTPRGLRGGYTGLCGNTTTGSARQAKTCAAPRLYHTESLRSFCRSPKPQ